MIRRLHPLVAVLPIGIVLVALSVRPAPAQLIAGTPVASPFAGSPVATSPSLLQTVQAKKQASVEAQATATSLSSTQTAAAQATETAVVIAENTAKAAAGETAVANAMAIATQNAELQQALIDLATSEAGAQATAAAAVATNQALSTEVANLDATVNAVPTATLTNTPTATPTPTPTPTPTSTPTATPLPESGTVLYQADVSGGFEAWSGSGWNLLDGMLLNDGSGGSIKAPFEVEGVQNYSVEAEIKLLEADPCTTGPGTAPLGVYGRQIDGKGGWSGGVEATCGVGRRAWLQPGDLRTKFDPLDDWHTYRLDIVGATASLYIDDVLMLQNEDNRYLTGGEVGIPCNHVQIDVRSFRVTVL